MKHPFFKSLLVLGAALALMNCSEENSASAPSSGDYVTPDACWVLNADQTMLIYATGVVTDANGNPVGIMNEQQTAIVSLDGTQFLVTNLDLGSLTILPAGSTVPETSATIPASSASVMVPASSNTVYTPASSAITTTPTSSAVTTTPKSSAQTQTASSNSQQQAKSSSSQQQQQAGTCYDKYSGTYVKPNDNLRGPNQESYAYAEDCTLKCYWDGTNNNCGAVTSGTTAPKSSSSQQQQQQKSSSSQAKSSSSQQSTNTGSTGASPNIQVVNGGISGSGKATRYWDSCKPHCAWEGKDKESNVGTARTCHADGTIAGTGERSVCDDGDAGTCADQAPVIVNDEYAYAFAAYSGNGAVCGRCFMLTFNGSTDNGSKPSINGKKLIIMISNIGYDVQQGNFDIMIPGGGVGAFSGCQKMGISCAGERYGGLLATCKGDKSCLIQKCNSEYSNTNLKNGCLFLANWLDAADNPHHSFKQVVCPSELVQKF